MNVQKVAWTSFGSKTYASADTVSFEQQTRHLPLKSLYNADITADNIIKTTVAGGLVGAICSRNDKTASALGHNVLRGIGAFLLGLVIIKSILAFIQPQQYS